MLIELQNELESMKRQATNDYTFKDNSKELTILQTRLAQREKMVSHFKQEMGSLLQQNKEATDMVEILKGKALNYSKQIVELRTELSHLKGSKVMKMEDELSTLENDNEKLKKKIQVLEDELIGAKQQAITLNTLLQQNGVSSVDLKQQLKEAADKVSSLLRTIKNLEMHFLKLKEENEETTDLVQYLNKRLKEMQSTQDKQRIKDQLKQLKIWMSKTVTEIKKEMDEGN
eukprot:TRINITY_DN8830_c0_g1_i1.p1 TRINITY_DN8830_c0_g1~~TRINITY_DN8830_c0_g1_i1.p1  ORF type:complete len:230 (-),score=48.47 TRINITY_DN8830_c0_g1_i1:45-734(-)